jgi:hypothetical protein
MSFHAQLPGLMYVENSGASFLTTVSQYERSPDVMTVCDP